MVSFPFLLAGEKNTLSAERQATFRHAPRTVPRRDAHCEKTATRRENKRQGGEGFARREIALYGAPWRRREKEQRRSNGRET